MSKLSFSNKEKKLFIVVIVLSCIFGLYQGVFIPLNQNFEVLENEIALSEKRLNKTLKTIRKSKNFEKKYSTILEEFKQTASDEQMMSSILSEIEGIAGQIETRISEMKTRRVRKIDFYNNFSVSITVDGELVDIMNFVYVLQNPPHMFQVDELNINRASPRQATLRCNLVLSRALIP